MQNLSRTCQRQIFIREVLLSKPRDESTYPQHFFPTFNHMSPARQTADNFKSLRKIFNQQEGADFSQKTFLWKFSLNYLTSWTFTKIRKFTFKKYVGKFWNSIEKSVRLSLFEKKKNPIFWVIPTFSKSFSEKNFNFFFLLI